MVDTVFVCRRPGPGIRADAKAFLKAVRVDCDLLWAAGLRVSAGDVRCIALRRLVGLVLNELLPYWKSKNDPVRRRLELATQALVEKFSQFRTDEVVDAIEQEFRQRPPRHASAQTTMQYTLPMEV